MKRPNVVVFFTDQQRWDSTGLHGNPLDLTPNFDRVAQAGTFVPHCYSCQPVCGPARSCLQTGQYATTTGVFHNGLPLNPEAVTLAKCFGQAGYQTGYIGKWHLGNKGDRAVARPFRGGYDYWLAANTLEMTSDAYQTRMWDSDDQPVDLPGYRVDAVTDAAIRYLDGHKADPFFLTVSYIEPHHQNHRDDYPAPVGYAERYHGRWTPPDLMALGGSSQRHLGGYWGMVKRLDEAYGRMLDALQSLHLLDSTIVLFITDHGCHFKTRNGEYKRSCHDSSIRLPCCLTGPGFTGGGRLPQMVSLVDLPPTLLDAAGLAVPATMQGRSIVPLLRGGGAADWPREVFAQISESQVARCIRTRRWKYSVHAPQAHPVKDSGSASYVEQCLYDLQADPYELNNLAGSEAHAPLCEKLRARLVARMVQAGEAAPTIEAAATTIPRGQRRVSEEDMEL